MPEDMTADDVVFNAARAMNLATKSAMLSPAAAVGTLAWRRSPYALAPIARLSHLFHRPFAFLLVFPLFFPQSAGFLGFSHILHWS